MSCAHCQNCNDTDDRHHNGYCMAEGCECPGYSPCRCGGSKSEILLREAVKAYLTVFDESAGLPPSHIFTVVAKRKIALAALREAMNTYWIVDAADSVLLYWADGGWTINSKQARIFGTKEEAEEELKDSVSLQSTTAVISVVK